MSGVSIPPRERGRAHEGLPSSRPRFSWAAGDTHARRCPELSAVSGISRYCCSVGPRAPTARALRSTTRQPADQPPGLFNQASMATPGRGQSCGRHVKSIPSCVALSSNNNNRATILLRPAPQLLRWNGHFLAFWCRRMSGFVRPMPESTCRRLDCGRPCRRYCTGGANHIMTEKYSARGGVELGATKSERL